MVQTGERFDWGLIGTGRHADRFIAPAIQHSLTGQLVAVFSRDMQRAKTFAEQHGNPSAYDDLDTMLADERIKAVFVCSPNFIHKEQVLRIARAGKHVLCEKPLANTVEDCLAMVAACRRAGVKLGVGFHLRHNPAHIKMKEMLTSGAIGRLTFAEIQYMHVVKGSDKRDQRRAWRLDSASAGGGSFVGTGVHAVDLLRFVLGKEITHVFAFADKSWNTSGREDLMMVSLLMEDHHVASLSAGRLRYPFNQFTLYGESATLRCSESIGNYGGGRLELISDQGSRVMEVDRCDVYIREVDAFAGCITKGDEPNASGHDGLKVVQITSSLYQSIQNKCMVELESSPLDADSVD